MILFYRFRSGDAQSESKQFQELLLERTKALAAQAEALKSNSDGKYQPRLFQILFIYIWKRTNRNAFVRCYYVLYISIRHFFLSFIVVGCIFLDMIFLVLTQFTHMLFFFMNLNWFRQIFKRCFCNWCSCNKRYKIPAPCNLTPKCTYEMVKL